MTSALDGRMGVGRGPEYAVENTILRGVVGSTALGTALDGHDDRDEMGVFVEAPEHVCGLSPFDHYIHRDQPNGVRSQPGDLDLTLYSLREYVRLATQGNPSVLILLWIPEHIVKTALGQQLIDMRDAFRSRESGERFLGYLISQRKALTGERTKKVSRPELVEQFGYDTKFAMHALRLGYEGIEYMRDGRITLPTPEPERETLMAIRRGEIRYGGALDLIERTEATLRDLVDNCTLTANREAIDRFLVEAHLNYWHSRFSSVVERRAVDAETPVQFREPGPSEGAG